MEAVLIDYIANIIVAILSLIFLFWGRHMSLEQCKPVQITAANIKCVELKHNLYIYTSGFGFIYFLPWMATIASIMASSMGLILWVTTSFYHWGFNIFIALGSICNFLILLCVPERERMIKTKITEPTYNEIIKATEEQAILWLRQFPHIFTHQLIGILLEIHSEWQPFCSVLKQENKR